MERSPAPKFTLLLNEQYFYLRNELTHKVFELKVDWVKAIPQDLFEMQVPNADSLVTFTICKGCGNLADKSFNASAEHCDCCVPCEEQQCEM